MRVSTACSSSGACWTAAVASPPLTEVRWSKACRLIPSRYPTVGLFDRIAAPEDIDALIEIESWTNDRISTELGILHVVPRDEWVVGRPMASVIMAAFCHPRPGGGRFSSSDRGAWYAARSVETSLAETIHHRTRELAEVGHFDTRVEMRLYHADFRDAFHDIRPNRPAWAPLYDPESYTASQQFGRELFEEGSNGVVYRSVRHEGGECLACFRPARVLNVRVAGHYEYKWEGRPEPRVRKVA
jgi:hypothetical protein